MTSLYGGPPFCCDADALITFIRTRRFMALEAFARRGLLRIPLGVYREVHPHQRQGPEKRMLEEWVKDDSIVVDIDKDTSVRLLLPAIERSYGPPFNVGGITYPGFWKSKAGRKAADGEVVAFARTNGWAVIANDNSVHGACLLEGIECHRWEYLALVLDREPPPPAAPLQSHFPFP